MPFTLTMPKLSPTMEEGTITSWHKKVGDYVEAGDVLFEVATDKATVEYNALDSGWLRSIIITDGKEAIVNQPIAIFTDEKDESIEGYQPEGASKEEAIAAPSMEEKIESPSPRYHPEPQPTPAKEEPQKSSIEAPVQPSIRAPEMPQRILASPLAKKIAKEQGFELSRIKGTGPGGRIMSRDLAQAEAAEIRGYKELPIIPAGTFEEEPLSQMRKAISKRLQEAKTYIPHFYVTIKVNAEPLIDIRQQLKNFDLKVTYNDLIVRASALALRNHPAVNSGFNTVNNSLIRFKTIDISIAVSIPTGLITPIVRHADYKSILDISEEIKELAARAKEGKLKEDEYKGGSFTISNLGMYGVEDFIPIINPPQAAILAVSGIQEVPVVRNGQIVPGHQMALTLSGDHRVIDGVSGAEFLNTLKQYLESPASLLIM